MTITEITEKQKEQLLQVNPSNGTMEYRPCQVTLKNGETFDNVYIQEEQNYLTAWGVMPDADPGKRYLLIEEVAEIKESPKSSSPRLS